MQIVHRAFVALITVLVIGQSANAAIIKAAGGRRKATLSGKVTITTTTAGQRQIAIKIDPDVTTAFRLDFLYPDDVVTPLGFKGFNTTLQNEAIIYSEPYAPVGGGPTILPPTSGGAPTGLLSNIEGRYQFAPSALITEPLPNRPDGGSDLFTLLFIDNNPSQDKSFKILGTEKDELSPKLAGFAADNYIDFLIDDPNDPENGQIVRIAGEDIEGATIFIPGEPKGGSGVPLPGAAASGLVCASALWLTRQFKAWRTAV